MSALNRRGFLSGIIAACVAPAIIRTPGLIMPVKPILETGIIRFGINPLPGDSLSYSRFTYLSAGPGYAGSRTLTFLGNKLICDIADDIFATATGPSLLELERLS